MYPDDFNYVGYLKFRVLTGDIDFSALVEALSEQGYLTEIEFPERAGMSSSHMERLTQEEFDELFAFFYPDRVSSISLECIATNEGVTHPTGAYSYALINRAVLSHQEGIDILERENYASEFTEFDLVQAKEDLLEFIKVSIERLSEQRVQDELKRHHDYLLVIETRLKSLRLLPLSEEEQTWQTLDNQFPFARSKEIVELDGLRYVRVFTPAEKDENGNVSRWAKHWHRLGPE